MVEDVQADLEDVVSQCLNPQFSAWAPWSKRNDLEIASGPGVYVLGHTNPPQFDKAGADPIAKTVLYIGETTGNTLQGRWRQFQRAVTGGTAPHAGGKTYGKKFGAAKLEELAVAGFRPSAVEDRELPLAIKFVERWLLWRYAREWGVLPACNKL